MSDPRTIETEFRPDGVLEDGIIMLRRYGMPMLVADPSIPYRTRVRNVTVGRIRFDDDWEEPEVEDWTEGRRTVLSIMDTAYQFHQAFNAACEVIEELAWTITGLRAINYDPPDSPGPGWYWVRGHWRSHKNGAETIPSDPPEATPPTGVTDSTPAAANEPLAQRSEDTGFIEWHPVILREEWFEIGLEDDPLYCVAVCEWEPERWAQC